jgi:hypothetical protein
MNAQSHYENYNSEFKESDFFVNRYEEKIIFLIKIKKMVPENDGDDSRPGTQSKSRGTYSYATEKSSYVHE